MNLYGTAEKEKTVCDQILLRIGQIEKRVSCQRIYKWRLQYETYWKPPKSALFNHQKNRTFTIQDLTLFLAISRDRNMGIRHGL